MDSSPSKANVLPQLPSVSGVKRPAPSLLPAFEPFSSSPGFSRPSKKQNRTSPSKKEAYTKYPTPIPTSTTGILSSSPPRVHEGRPTLHRTNSVVSERAPLCAVPAITLPENGDEVLMGRSSNSSHYQLSANRLISRVHVKARYVAATVPLEPNQIEIRCCGWNGIKLHSTGQTWELGKGDTFTSKTEFAEIMMDVQDARVRITWPGCDRKTSVLIDSTWDDDGSPRRRNTAVDRDGNVLESSPIHQACRLRSPESPTPAGQPIAPPAKNLMAESFTQTFVQVYEDESSSPPKKEESQSDIKTEEKIATLESLPLTKSQSSELSEPEESDPDEENDPVIHSFGPFGANILPRMASITTSRSPERTRVASKRDPSASPVTSSSPGPTHEVDNVPVANHVINQLAFSRLSSTPLSVIMNNLPSDLKARGSTYLENRALTKSDLRRILDATKCIGEIQRAGKDAAGKPLESEYYYMPDEDQDEQRRAAVVDGLRKPSLRNCRKQHKQYYWKKPKTP